MPQPDESCPVRTNAAASLTAVRLSRMSHTRFAVMLPLRQVRSVGAQVHAQCPSRKSHSRHTSLPLFRECVPYAETPPVFREQAPSQLPCRARPDGTADAGASSSDGRAVQFSSARPGALSPGMEGSQHGSDTGSASTTPRHRANVGPALAHLQPEVPFEYASFDVIRGATVHFLPHCNGPEDAVRHALQHAPFPDPTWAPTRVHVPGFPQFQLLLLRRHATVTVLFDTRPLEGEVSVHEIGPEPFTGHQLATQVPPAGGAPLVAQLLRASQLTLFHNHRPWLLAYAIQLLTGDLVCFASRAGAFLQLAGTGLRWAPGFADSTAQTPPLLVARVGVAGYGSGIGVAPRPHLLLALARALRSILQEIPRLDNFFLAASPLQDPACHTFQEVRFVLTSQIGGDVSLSGWTAASSGAACVMCRFRAACTSVTSASTRVI